MTQIELQRTDQAGAPVRFDQGFTIGRDATCDLPVDSPLVSRVHAAVSLEEGAWWAVDLGSTNGIFVDGNRVERHALVSGSVLQIGRGGPQYVVQVRTLPQDAPGPPSPDRTQAAEPPLPPVATGTASPASPSSSPPLPTPPSPASTPPGAATELPPPEEPPPGRGRTQEPKRTVHTGPAPSMDDVMERYFSEEDDQNAGEHTRLIRQAYRTRKKRDRTPWLVGSGILVLLLVAAGGTVFFQQQRIAQLEETALHLFEQLREDEVRITAFRQLLEDRADAALEEQLSELQAQRSRRMEQYEGYIEELGFYRRLRDDRERSIYRMARTFGESEFSMSAEFVQAVQAEIDSYWLSRSGRARMEEAIDRAARLGYTPVIVRTLEEHGLPPEFYYLALQESDLRPDRVGPETRYGRAKGMWQFIPATAKRYDLEPGPQPNHAGTDPYDRRLDFSQSTTAAARYLRDLHGELSQASGLLVMAAYNWGEHRVEPRLQGLDTPDETFRATFDDVAQTPQDRNYWRFLSEHANRMPDETKDYVLKIFSAAVLGSNPRVFGLDMDDPLESLR